MQVILLDSADWDQLPKNIRPEKFTELVNSEFPKINKLLVISKHLNIIIKPNLPHVIDFLGVGGSTYDSELLDITFDPKKAGDKGFFKTIVATLYHELNHAARFLAINKYEDKFDWIILEGLGTVFEREYSGYDPPWGKYDLEVVKDWIKELRDLDKLNSDYWFKHPDGRRWIAYKCGTYIVDEAVKRSGKTVLDLTGVETKEILKLSRTRGF